MKYTTSLSHNNMSSGREFVSLSPKISSSSVQDTFSYQYNSPKTLPAKGFVLPQSNNENLTVLTRPQKETPLSKQMKAKGLKASALVADNSIQNQKMLITMTVNQASGTRDEKRSSTLKTKGESLRTMSSTPKGSNPYKSFEPLKTREDSSYSSNQYRWKKLEISTEFNNTKTSYGKAQTTKHTEVDENVVWDSLTKTLVTQQSVPKSLQNKSENTQNYSYYAHEARARENEQKSRSSRPLSNSEIGAKNLSVSPQREQLTKENLKTSVYLPSDKEYNAPRTPAKKKKNSLNLTAKTASDESSAQKKMSNTLTQFDLKSTQQTAENEPVKKKTRALSAKKVTQETKEDQQLDKSALKEEKGTPQKASLNSFVSKVNKGDVFSSIKKYGDKRDNSAKKPQKKPSLNFDEKPSKAVKTSEFEIRGAKTTPNQEAKTYSINLARNQAAANVAQKPATKEMKQSASSSKELVKTVQDASVRSRTQEPFIYHMTGLEKAYRWTSEPDYFVQIYREHFLQSYQALTFVKTLKATDPSVIAQKKVNLPRREAHKNRKTLVFDMDETLIHCNESTDMPSDVILPILFPNGEIVEAGVNVRPYAIECLKELSQYYEIVVFTASHSCYANVVLDYLDPQGQYIHHRLFRESCVVTDEGVHIKDLRVIGNRNLQDLVLIDNAAYSFGFQVDNGIPIIPFYDNPADQELRHLTPYLKFLGSAKDMRDINRETFKLHMYTSFDTPEEVLERIMLRD